MSTKTKKLSAGVPIVDSSGAITPVSIAELAKQVGEVLGIQRANYEVRGPGWIRLAKIGRTSGLIFIHNGWFSSGPSSVVISFAGNVYLPNSSIKIVSGTPNVFNKMRFVITDNETFLEAYSHLGVGQFNPWYITMLGSATASVLYQSTTEGIAGNGSEVKEYTLAELSGGGKTHTFNKLQKDGERRVAA